MAIKVFIRILLILMIGIFLGQVINPMPRILEKMMFNQYFQFLVIFIIALDIFNFRKNRIAESAFISVTILIFFEYLRTL